jgi:Ca2+-binding EF-hand superfamily protein
MEFLSVISKGTTMDKLSWAFTFYDVDNDGYISKEEMLKVAILLKLFKVNFNTKIPKYIDKEAVHK